MIFLSELQIKNDKIEPELHYVENYRLLVENQYDS
jgi:hypothetical protein